MRNALILVLFCLLLAIPARSDEAVVLHLKLRTHPPDGVKVYLERPGVEPFFLGTSNQDLVLPTVTREQIASDGPTIGWKLELKRDGYQTPPPVPLELRHHLKGGNLLSGYGEVTLQPASWVIALRDNPTAWTWVVLAGVVGGVSWYRTRGRAPKRPVAEGEPVDPWLGRTVDRWTLVQLLGRGGMATVYRGVPTATMSDAESVAIKIMHPDIAQNEAAIGRFQREIRVCCQLSHPNMVKVLDWGTGDLHYLVMDFVRGRTLRHRIRPPGQPAAEVRRLLQPIFSAVGFAHEHGVLHRDLKPENIMLTIDERPLVMDFGLARGDEDSTVTHDGMVPGTLGYMAPEQLRGEKAGPPADQYALGVILYELMCGHQPYQVEETGALIYGTLLEPPPPLPGHDHVNGVLERMLAKRPEERFPSVVAAWEALDQALQQEA
ncbi:MAG: serine/threonine-protein kinase [Candidatus Xenobia bacterium]